MGLKITSQLSLHVQKKLISQRHDGRELMSI